MNMKLYGVMVSIVIMLATSVPVGQSAQISREGTSPVVIKTYPESGATNVDPSISEIRVTFSKEMMDKSWSWVQISPENFPKLISNPRYLNDKKTCVVDVKLEPGKTYIIWLNTQKFRNFKDKDSRPAVSYLLMFETRK